MKEIEALYKTGLLSEQAYNEVSRIAGNLQEQYEMDAYKAGKRIGELETALDEIAGYATIETPEGVTEIINRVMK